MIAKIVKHLVSDRGGINNGYHNENSNERWAATLDAILKHQIIIGEQLYISRIQMDIKFVEISEQS